MPPQRYAVWRNIAAIALEVVASCENSREMRFGERSQKLGIFFDRGNLVPDVNPVQVDVIGLQPLEVRFHGLHHILAVIAGRVRIGPRSSTGVFRGQDHALAMVPS